MMTTDTRRCISDEIGLDDAYGLETPDDNRRLYGRWAQSYDENFVQKYGYVYDRNVVEAFLRRPLIDGPVLDVGCGTGLVGQQLAGRGVTDVHGVDISPEMLAEATTKTDADSGKPVYSQLAEADLTAELDYATGTYSGIISAGTFTHGHLGPESLDELVRVARIGATIAIGVNSAHFTEQGFDIWLAEAMTDGRVAKPELVKVSIYNKADEALADAAIDDDDNKMGTVMVFTRSTELV